MNNHRITCSKSKIPSDTEEVISTFDPFAPRKSIPRDPDFNNSRKTLSLESLTASLDTTIQFRPSSTPVKKIT